jgi:hypothetical protein
MSPPAQVDKISKTQRYTPLVSSLLVLTRVNVKVKVASRGDNYGHEMVKAIEWS